MKNNQTKASLYTVYITTLLKKWYYHVDMLKNIQAVLETCMFQSTILSQPIRKPQSMCLAFNCQIRQFRLKPDCGLGLGAFIRSSERVTCQSVSRRFKRWKRWLGAETCGGWVISRSKRFTWPRKRFILLYVYLPWYNFSMALTGLQVAFLYNKNITHHTVMCIFLGMGCIYVNKVMLHSVARLLCIYS